MIDLLISFVTAYVGFIFIGSIISTVVIIALLIKDRDVWFR